MALTANSQTVVVEVYVMFRTGRFHGFQFEGKKRTHRVGFDEGKIGGHIVIIVVDIVLTAPWVRALGFTTIVLKPGLIEAFLKKPVQNQHSKYRWHS